LRDDRRQFPTLQPVGENNDPSDVTMRITVAAEEDTAEYVTIRVIAGRDMLNFATLARGEQILIGRDDNCELRLQDRAVSKRHAIINSDNEGKLTLIDLGSTNGSFVNGEQIDRADIQIGDHIDIGDVALRVLTSSQSEIKHLKRILNRLEAANRDALTGLLTRAFLDEELPKLLARCDDLDAEISCAFIDLDHFKPVNDTFGHQVGDEVLKNVARILMMHVRSGDHCIRYGGDELLIILPGAPEQRTVRIITRIQRAIVGHDWSRIASGLKISASFGVAGHYRHEAQHSWLNRVDQAVYAAKSAGRNTVVAYSLLRSGQSSNGPK
jgi:diguanylate cyclase (GGDEF)-like protein